MCGKPLGISHKWKAPPPDATYTRQLCAAHRGQKVVRPQHGGRLPLLVRVGAQLGHCPQAHRQGGPVQHGQVDGQDLQQSICRQVCDQESGFQGREAELLLFMARD